MQHKIKGQLALDGPNYSVRASHPIATRLWSEGYSYQTVVGRWAVVWAMPGSTDADGAWRIYASLNVARMTSRSRAVAYARYRREQRYHDGPYFRARVVRWRKWMRYPQGIATVETLIDRHNRLARLLDLDTEAQA